MPGAATVAVRALPAWMPPGSCAAFWVEAENSACAGTARALSASPPWRSFLEPKLALSAVRVMLATAASSSSCRACRLLESWTPLLAACTARVRMRVSREEIWSIDPSAVCSMVTPSSLFWLAWVMPLRLWRRLFASTIAAGSSPARVMRRPDESRLIEVLSALSAATRLAWACWAETLKPMERVMGGSGGGNARGVPRVLRPLDPRP